ncbi:MAG: PIG-L family deacetylase [Candidatus Acidiferrum sp.]
MKRFVSVVVLVSLLALLSTPLSTPPAEAQFPPAPGTGPGLAETVEAIDSAAVTTRILYITAHPDDESAPILTYLARGLHADVALLSLTRGEGGQNALGPEQAPQLGLIRTQELLAATRGYGVKLYFTRARDFGYSKTAEETEKIWGDQVLEDMVRVIRTVRPNIVINNLIGGHGHHVAAGLLTPKAVQLAADPSAYPQLGADMDGLALTSWGGAQNPVKVLNVDRGGRKPNAYLVPVDEISPLYGKSYREIALDAFTNHRTQGITNFINSPFLSLPLALVAASGEPFDPKILALTLEEWPYGKDNPWTAAIPEIARKIKMAHTAALSLDWVTAAKSIASARTALIVKGIGNREEANSHTTNIGEVSGDAVVIWKLTKRLDHALALAAGLRITADADRSELVTGEDVVIKTTAHCRPEVHCEFGPNKLDGSSAEAPSAITEIKRTPDGPERVEITASVGQLPPPNPETVISPVAPPLAVIAQPATIFGYKLEFDQPVTHVAASTTKAERVPLRIVPAYTLAVEPNQVVDVLSKPPKPYEVLLRVHSYATQAAKIQVGLEVPAGWTSSAAMPLEFAGAGDQYARLMVSAPGTVSEGNYTITAYAQRGSEKFTNDVEPFVSMPILLWTSPAECVVHAFDVNVPKDLTVGYISAESEPVPEALARLGIHVDALDAQALNFSNLHKYDAVVVGVRAYELRPELAGANQRLLEYVSQGGTLVVEYQRDFAWDKFQYAPYPAKIDSDKPGAPLPRITDETAAVTFLKPDDALLNMPNKITQKDFAGWVQERGLYFWSQFDAQYTPLLAMHDPGESDQNGGLVYTRYGKGVYIYTALAFFRQLPEGVPGAYRLFVNLLSTTREASPQR